MMNAEQRMVEEFHKAFGHPVASQPQDPLTCGQETNLLRIDLIQEEADELIKAIRRNNMVAVADALGDLLYVIYGAGLVYGIDLEPVFAEIHASNMTKLGADGQPVLDAPGGKVVAGPNYREPNLRDVLLLQLLGED